MLNANPALIRRRLHSSYCAGFNLSHCVTLESEAGFEVGLIDPHPVQDAGKLAPPRQSRTTYSVMAIDRPHARNDDHFLIRRPGNPSMASLSA
jgi:hypothetical protein